MERPTGTASRRKKNILIPGIVLLGAGILLVCALLVRNGSVTARNPKAGGIRPNGGKRTLLRPGWHRAGRRHYGGGFRSLPPTGP